MMKHWKAMLCATLLCGTMAIPAQGETLQTVGGLMTLPSGLHSASVSNMETLQAGKEVLAYEAAKLKSKPVDATNRKSLFNIESSQKILDNIGKVVDVYELYGTSQYGEQSAWMMAVDVRSAAVQTGLYKEVSLPIDWHGDVVLSPEVEAAMIQRVNGYLPKLESSFNKKYGDNNFSVKVQDNKPAQKVHFSNVRNLKVEDIEYMQKQSNTKYPTYTVGMRAMYTQYGLQYPTYVKAALVMNPAMPTLYTIVTDDMQRGYFMPKLDDMFKSIK